MNIISSKLKWIIAFILLFILCFQNVVSAEGNYIKNGNQFKDTSGNVIHAHGGGMIKYEDYYYWYGEYRDSSNFFLGVRCYRSKDLVNWEYRGEVLAPSSHSELNRCNVERPKVMYNKNTKEFVMWMHWENGVHYGEARAAVAYCNSPDGKFTYQGSSRPMVNSGVMDHDLPGYMSRDCSVFVDTDGKGYFISSSNENMDLHLYELTSDYKQIASLKAKLFVGMQREAPCLIKRNGYYYLITSGCTGWQPNQSKYTYSKDLASGWSSQINLGNANTFRSQPAYIIAVQGTETTSFLYTGDRWAGAWSGKVNDSQYVWLPLVFDSDTKLELPYYESISIDAEKGTISENILDKTKYKIVNRNSGKLLSVKDFSTLEAAEIVQLSDKNDESQQWYIIDVGDGYKKISNVKSGKSLDVKDASTANGGVLIQYTSNGGNNQHWEIVNINDGYFKIISRASNKLVDVYKWSTDENAIIQQWEDVDGENQHWQFIEIKEEAKQILGDINDDKKINSVDCILMIQIILGENANVHNLDFQKRADLNNDGQVNILDAILIRTYILKSF